MKKNSFSLTGILVAAIGILMIVSIFSSRNFVATTGYDYSSINLPDTDTAFGGIFSSLHTEDSVPYYLYKKAEDSFKRVEQIRDLKNNGKAMESFSIGGVGIFSAKKKSSTEFSFPNTGLADPAIKTLLDSLDKLHNDSSVTQVRIKSDEINKKINERMNYRTDSVNRELEKEKLYYFGLSGYEFRDYDTKFFIDNNSYNLAYVKWDTSKNQNTNLRATGHYVSKQIKVRYAADVKTILIPITEKTHAILNFVIWTFAFITGALILYFFFGLPIRLLINISKGQAFIERNIQILNQISRAAFVIFFLTVLSPYIFRLLFWKIIPDDFKMEPFLNRFFDNLFILIMALVTFLIAKAFKKGHKLQYEQDLTI